MSSGENAPMKIIRSGKSSPPDLPMIGDDDYYDLPEYNAKA